MTTPIPRPRSIPLLGNVHQIDSELPLLSYVLLAKTYGEIFELNILGICLLSKRIALQLTQFPGKRIIFVTSYDLANEVADESRFRKEVGGALNEARNLVGDGLFSVGIISSLSLQFPNLLPRPIMTSPTGRLLVSFFLETKSWLTL